VEVSGPAGDAASKGKIEVILIERKGKKSLPEQAKYP